MSNHLIVAFGGTSPEHEVSVLTAIQAISALEGSSHQVIPLYISKSGKWFTGAKLLDLSSYKDLPKLERESISCTFSKTDTGATVLKETSGGGLFSKPNEYSIYAVFMAFHGSDGENGSFQGICEQFNVPYTGSGVLASSVGMNKVAAKRMCQSVQIPVAQGVDFFEQEWVDNQDNLITEVEKISYPLVVKPVTLGSSIGVSRVSSQTELVDAIEVAFRYDAHLLVEEAIHPLTEINCSVLGMPDDCRASVCERPLGVGEALSFEDKYQSDAGTDKGMASADRIIPADISDELTHRIQELSVAIFKLFNASGVARLDFLVNSDTEEVYFNEINTIPGSFSFYLWDKSDVDFKSLIHELIDIALKRHQQKNGRVRSYETNLLSEKAATGIKGLKGK